MRRSVVGLTAGIGAAAAVVLVTVSILRHRGGASILDILGADRSNAQPGGLSIQYPLNETLFPPEIPAPTFRWTDTTGQSDTYLVVIEFADDPNRLTALTQATHWTPSDEQWEAIKRRSLEEDAKVTVLGVRGRAPKDILCEACISIRTSRDEVGAPVIYRDVNLPFLDAAKDPSRIRWRFGCVSSTQPPPVVLENLPVCGNCHSFSADGQVLGMDVDHANDKGSYVLSAVSKEILLTREKIITWSDYRREDGEKTFGLLSQVSPDGRYVASTVKDRSVFVAKGDLTFSQLFFPIQGILGIYCRQTRTFAALSGADDKRYVQSNPTWSPDGKYIVFARAKAYDLPNLDKERERKTALLAARECQEFLTGAKQFRFSLYRIPFRDGKGGKAEPLRGASHNGWSNYFAKYSPDGKWIVFCRAKSFMLLQPDSELYIIPAAGGEAMRMRCNTCRMNSWHSFSPNGKWMVFSSKANTPYTQLFLTHIDQDGRSSPAVLLSRFTSRYRAANIPEFVRQAPGAIVKIREQFVDDVSYLRSALTARHAGDLDQAARACRQALALNPANADTHKALADILLDQKKHIEAEGSLRKAIQCRPDFTAAHLSLGKLLFRQHKYRRAAEHYHRVLQAEPENAAAHKDLGTLLLGLGQMDEGLVHLTRAVRIEPRNAMALHNLGVALHRAGRTREAIARLTEAAKIEPNFHTHVYLAEVLSKNGQVDQAVAYYGRAAKTKPDDAQTHAKLGALLGSQGKLKDSMAHLVRATRLDPNHADALHNLGLALSRAGRPNEAVAPLARAARLRPNCRTSRALGDLLARSGQCAQAAGHYRTALKLTPNYVPALVGLASVLSAGADPKVRDGTQAVALAQKACELTRFRSPGPLDVLAAAYAESGMFDQAVRAATKAVASARAAGKAAFAREAAERLDLYRHRKPFRHVPSP